MLWDRHVDIRLRLGPGVSRVQEWGRGEGGTATNLFQGWLAQSQAVLLFILRMGPAENEKGCLCVMYGYHTHTI